MSAALLDRFLAKVARRPDGTGCWDWIGGTARGGYGKLKVRGRVVAAHRLALQHRLPRRLLRSEEALHWCDRPCCVRPDHLRPGDRLENEADKRRGEKRR